MNPQSYRLKPGRVFLVRLKSRLEGVVHDLFRSRFVLGKFAKLGNWELMNWELIAGMTDLLGDHEGSLPSHAPLVVVLPICHGS